MKVNYIYLILLTNNTFVNNNFTNNTYYPTPRWYKICKSSKKY